MKIINDFELSVGGITSGLKGYSLASLENDAFCQAILGEDVSGSNVAYGGGGSDYNSDLIYAVPVKEKGRENEPSNENVVINLLMQLKAFQNGGDTIVRNSEMVKQQLIKQLQVEGAGISSHELKSQIMKVGNDAVNGKIDDKEYNRVISSVAKSVKKKIKSDKYPSKIINTLNVSKEIALTNNYLQNNNLYENFKSDTSIFKNMFKSENSNNFEINKNLNTLNMLNVKETFLKQIQKDYETVSKNRKIIDENIFLTRNYETKWQSNTLTKNHTVLQATEQHDNEETNFYSTNVTNKNLITLQETENHRLLSDEKPNDIKTAIRHLSKIVLGKTEKETIKNRIYQRNEENIFDVSKTINNVYRLTSDTVIQEPVLNEALLVNDTTWEISDLISNTVKKIGKVSNVFKSNGKDKRFEQSLLNRIQLNSTFMNAEETVDIYTEKSVVTDKISVLERNHLERLQKTLKTKNELFSTEIINRTLTTVENIVKRNELVNLEKERIVVETQTNDYTEETKIENVEHRLTQRLKTLEKVFSDKSITNETLEKVVDSKINIVNKLQDNDNIISNIKNVISKNLNFISNIKNITKLNRKSNIIHTEENVNDNEVIELINENNKNVFSTVRNINKNTEVIKNLTENEKLIETQIEVLDKNMDVVTETIKKNKMNLRYLSFDKTENNLIGSVEANVSQVNKFLKKVQNPIVRKIKGASTEKTIMSKTIDLINREQINLKNTTEVLQEENTYSTIENLEEKLRENTEVLKNIVESNTLKILKPQVRRMVTQRRLLGNTDVNRTTVHKVNQKNIETEINNKDVELEYLYNEKLDNVNIVENLKDQVLHKTDKTQIFRLIKNSDELKKSISVNKNIRVFKENETLHTDDVVKKNILTLTENINQIDNGFDQMSSTEYSSDNVYVEPQSNNIVNHLIHQDGEPSNNANSDSFTSSTMVYREPPQQPAAPQMRREQTVEEPFYTDDSVLRNQAMGISDNNEEAKTPQNIEPQLTKEQINEMIEERASEIAKEYFKRIDMKKVSREIIQRVEKNLLLGRRRYGM